MNILIVSVHVDDETLGAGGTLLKQKAMGNRIFWLNITNMKEEYGYSREQIHKMKEEMERVQSAYGIEKIFDLRLEPAGLSMNDLSSLVRKISEIVVNIEPEVVILPYPYDIHSDHRIVFEAAFSCTKTFRFPFVKKVLCMETISETDYALEQNGFIPNYFVDISKYIDGKIAALKIYEGELGDPPFPRNLEAIKGLASFRGAGCGARYAESFRAMKIIE